jgi:transposase
VRSIRVVGQVEQRQQRLREGRKRRRGVRRRRLCQREEFALRGLEQGLSRTVVEGVEVGVDDSRRPAWVISVRPRAGARNRCPQCGRRCPGRDRGDGRRRWRGLDSGVLRVFIEADAPRVSCPEHGVLVAAVPWARHKARCTRFFEQAVACKVSAGSTKQACKEFAITWRTAAAICKRVCAEQAARSDPFAGLRMIGFDEISYRKRHRYLTVVLDHRTGRLIWAAKGRCRAVVERFLDLLGPQRCAQLELVSCDDADWITQPVAERCPNAEICLDAFHIVKAAGEALDTVRRDAWNQARRAGDMALARKLKTVIVFRRKPADLSDGQKRMLDSILELNESINTAYLLKEQLREVYWLPYKQALALLDAWLACARDCPLAPFVRLAERLTQQRAKIEAALFYRFSNARVEQLNCQLRQVINRSFGFRSANAVIAAAMLSLGGLCPPPPRDQLGALPHADPPCRTLSRLAIM